MLLNPYVVVFTARTTVTLLGYAALPWLLLAVHRGLRVPRGWWWPAAFALALALTGGGVNAAVDGVGAGRPAAARRLRALDAARCRGGTSGASAGATALLSALGSRLVGRAGRSSTRSTASTSCASPSSPGRSGRRRACPSRCARWATGSPTSGWVTAATRVPYFGNGERAAVLAPGRDRRPARPGARAAAGFAARAAAGATGRSSCCSRSPAWWRWSPASRRGRRCGGR